MSKLFYTDFDEYVKDFPDGERFRNWITNVNKFNKKGSPKEVLIVKGTGMHNGIPGDYLWASKITYTKDGRIAIGVHDCDDGLMIRHCSNEQEFTEWMNNLKDFVPFDMHELTNFGFTWD